MKKLFLILLVTFLIAPISIFAQNEKKKAVYFYSETCPRCLNVENYFNEEKIFEKYDIQKLDTHQNENFIKLNDLFATFGIDEDNRGVPVIFFDRKFLAGDTPIINDFVKEIDNSEANFFPDSQSLHDIMQAEKAVVDSQKKKYVSSIPLLIIVKAGLSDVFFDPCSLVVLVFLIIFLFFSKSKKRIWLFGSIFSLAILLMHLFLAFWLYNSFGNALVQKCFSIGIGVFSIAIGIANLKNVLWHKKNPIFENKKVYQAILKWREIKKIIITKFSTPAGFFILGLISSLFLFSSANEPYRAILSSLKQENNFFKSIEFSLFYNIIFIIPFALCAWFLEKFSQTKKFALFHEKIFGLIKFFLGVIMVFAGLYLLLIWIN